MRWFNQHEGLFRLGVFIASVIPGAVLAYQYVFDQLGINPFAKLIEDSGFWAVFFMLVTLGVTPVRRWLTWLSKAIKAGYGKRLADWNFLIKSRRQLGLWCLFYASVHFWVYMHFELDWWWEDLLFDIKERPFIAIGIGTWVCLVLLGITSPDGVRRAMGKRWRQLHRLMYVLSVAGVIHIFLEAKPNDYSPYWYIAIASVLLLHRILVNQYKGFRRKDDTGMPSYR